jgi:NAD(P)H-dependent flavin oxidoreductase YrpB (nitropropane dioxygenase family)
MLAEAGVDAILAKGAEAGAHRGTFAGPFESAMIPTFDLVPRIHNAVSLPVIASGGIMAICCGMQVCWPAHASRCRQAAPQQG